MLVCLRCDWKNQKRGVRSCVCPHCSGNAIKVSPNMLQIAKRLHKAGLRLSKAGSHIELLGCEKTEILMVHIEFAQEYDERVFTISELPSEFEHRVVCPPNAAPYSSVICADPRFPSLCFDDDAKKTLRITLRRLRSWVERLESPEIRTVLILAGFFSQHYRKE